MNSYNENLHSSVVTSLQSEELKRKKVKAKLKASMFTLYYAQGATITANEGFEAAEKNLKFKGSVKTQAVEGNDISNNLLYAQNQASQYLKQSVTNSAIAASNVQIAATAVLKLASDLGSIYSIVNAADFDTDIYRQAQSARDYMNDTAYAAEMASQTAMEASMLMSESSFPTVLDNAKSNGSLMNNLLKIVAADYDNADESVDKSNASLAAADVKEKAAEGVLEENSADYQASVAAYKKTNIGLNLGLVAFAGRSKPQAEDCRKHHKRPKGTESSHDKVEENKCFTVGFNLLKSPFEPPSSDPYYPVNFQVLHPQEQIVPEEGLSGYNIIVVKSTKKTTFTLSDAESLLSNTDDKRRYIPVYLLSKADPTLECQVTKVIDIDNGPVYDSDGEILMPGTRYVVFIMAVLKDSYKKLINTFDDFLSAPSAPFHLTIALESVDYHNIKVYDDSNSLTFWLKNSGSQQPGNSFSPLFKVQYRCILLPVNDKGETALLTPGVLNKLDSEVSKLQQIADYYDPKITQVEDELVAAASGLKDVPAADIDPFKKMGSVYTPLSVAAQHELEKEAAALDALQQQLAGMESGGPDRDDLVKKEKKKSEQVIHIKKLYAEYEKLLREKSDEMKQVQEDVNKEDFGSGPPPFFFNLELAESISAGNCVNAIKLPDIMPIEPGYPVYAAYFGPDLGPGSENPPERLLTDCFGNLLKNKKKYLPVILSFADESEESQGQFTNAISDISRTQSFEYHESPKN